MSTAETPEGAPEPVALTSLLSGPRVRKDGLDLDHAAALALVVDQLPPIHVVKSRGGYAVLSGEHRARAHVIANRDYISAYILDLPRSDWFMYAVNANREHGKALTLQDRKFIAAELLKDDPNMSSNAVAEAAGLSPSTVGKMRGDQGGRSSGVQSGHLNRRGKDGKSYPVNDKAAADELRASIRSLMDDGLTDDDIRDHLRCSVAPVVGERKRWLADGPARNETSSGQDPAPGAGESGGEDPQDLPAAEPPDAAIPGGRGDGTGADEPDEAAAPPADGSDASGGGRDTPAADSPAGTLAGAAEKGPDASPPVASGPTKAQVSGAFAAALVLLTADAAEAAEMLVGDERDDRAQDCERLADWLLAHHDAVMDRGLRAVQS